MSKDTGGTASDTMTLRDYFAAKALPKAWDDWRAHCATTDGTDDEIYFPDDCLQDIATDAYKMADAMIAERSK